MYDMILLLAGNPIQKFPLKVKEKEGTTYMVLVWIAVLRFFRVVGQRPKSGNPAPIGKRVYRTAFIDGKFFKFQLLSIIDPKKGDGKEEPKKTNYKDSRFSQFAKLHGYLCGSRITGEIISRPCRRQLLAGSFV
jgi:hypothetical protein